MRQFAQWKEKIEALIAFVFLMSIAYPTFAADNLKKPHQIINDLRDRMYVIGETTGKFEQFIEAEHKAVQDIHKYASGAELSALVERNQQGQTPLMAAAFNGYSEIVAELLNYGIVKEGINDEDSKGMSAWVYVNFALRQAIGACNPAALNNPFTFVPLFVTSPYYQKSTENPYVKSRRLLEATGAKVDMQTAKGYWMDICKLQDDVTKEKIQKTNDLLVTVIEEGTDKFNSIIIFNAKMKQMAKDQIDMCSNKELKPIFQKTSCRPNMITYEQQSDKSYITEAEKVVFYKYRAETNDSNKKIVEAIQALGAPYNKFGIVLQQIFSKSDKSALDLYEGEITWGEFNKIRIEQSKSLQTEISRVANNK